MRGDLYGWTLDSRRGQRRPFGAASEVLCWLAVVLLCGRDGLTAQGTSPLTNIAAIKAISPEAAQQGLPVRLRGVITAFNPRWNDAFLQNESGGIYLAGDDRLKQVKVGDQAEVEGVTDPGSFAPIVLPRQVRPVGREDLPAPVAATRASLADGRFDSERIVIEAKVLGVSSEGQNPRHNVMMPDGPAIALLLERSLSDLPPRLRGATVRLMGVAAPGHNGQRQATVARMLVSPLDTIEILRPGPENPDDLPQTAIAELLRYKPHQGQSDHVRIRGVVTAVPSAEVLFLQDESGSVLVSLGQEESARTRRRLIGGRVFDPGETLEVTGAPLVERLAVVFRADEVKQLGRAEMPPAVTLPPAGLAEARYDGRRVSFEGRVVAQAHSHLSGRSEVTLEAGEVTAVADIPVGGTNPVVVVAGSRVRVDGVLDNRRRAEWDSELSVIHLASPAGLTILEGPPTNPIRLLLLIGAGIGVVSVTALAWAFALRRQVRARTLALDQTNARLRANEDRYALAVEAAHLGIWEHNPITGKVVWSGLHEALWGYGPGEFPGTYEGFASRVPPEDLPGFRAAAEQALARRKSFRYEHRVVWPDGSVHWISNHGRHLFDAGGKVCRIIGAALEITDLKHAEEAVRANEQRLASIIHGANAGTWEWNVQTGQTVFNEHWAGMVGYTLAELSPVSIDTWVRLVHPDDLKTSNALLERHFRGELDHYQSEARIRHKNGHWVWVADRGRVTSWTEDGKPLLMQGTHTDITDRKQTEQLLLRSQERLQLAQEAARAGVWEWNLETGENIWAEELWNLYGLAPHSRPPCYETWRDAIHPEDRARTEQRVRDAAAAGAEIRIEYRTSQPEGRERWLMSRGQPFRDMQGRVDRYVGIVMDITDRKSLEEDLCRLNADLEKRVVERTTALSAEVAQRQEREGQLRKFWHAVDQSPVTVMITDHTPAIEYVNPQFERETGYTVAEALGRNPRFLKSGTHPPAFYATLWQHLANGHTWRGEVCNRRKDGSLHWELAAIAPIFDSTGRTTHFVAIKEDITERRRVAEELHRAKETAEAANRAKGRFLANMSHEIRTPMNAMLGFAQLLLRDPDASTEQRHRLTTILHSGEHLLGIISEILEMARIESGGTTLNPAPFDLTLMLQDMEAMFSLRSRTQQIAFTIQPAAGLPQFLVADQTKLRQVLINLLGNAFKFTPTGGHITLRVQATPGVAGQVRLRAEVEDTGPGLAPEDAARLFEPFFQTNLGRAAGGTGLGLSISREFARLMGGDLKVSSEVGVGSRFDLEVLLPVAEARPEPDEGVCPQVRRLKPEWAGYEVLVVDDVAENREVLTAMLATLDFDVGTAAHGQEAVDQCLTRTPGLVLLDLQMPVMDGYEACRRLRAAHGPSLKILVFSASVGPEARQEVLAAGADAFLRKPCRDSELLKCIRDLTGVEYVLGVPEPASASSPATVGTDGPSADAMRRLPDEWVIALRHAVVEGDYATMRTLVARISTQDEALGRRLRELLASFNYAAIETLLKPE